MMEAQKAKPVIAIEMENGREIRIELDADAAPITVRNFVKLVSEGFYDGLIFHRVIPGFMIQGGDPTGNGTGGSSDAIPGEFSDNGFVNRLKHTRGAISMARTADPNSASSQFFIMVEDSGHLDGQYASFGRVILGMDEVDRIVNTERDFRDKPIQDQRIKKAVMIE